MNEIGGKAAIEFSDHYPICVTNPTSILCHKLPHSIFNPTAAMRTFYRFRFGLLSILRHDWRVCFVP